MLRLSREFLLVFLAAPPPMEMMGLGVMVDIGHVSAHMVVVEMLAMYILLQNRTLDSYISQRWKKTPIQHCLLLCACLSMPIVVIVGR